MRGKKMKKKSKGKLLGQLFLAAEEEQFNEI